MKDFIRTLKIHLKRELEYAGIVSSPWVAVEEEIDAFAASWKPAPAQGVDTSPEALRALADDRQMSLEDWGHLVEDALRAVAVEKEAQEPAGVLFQHDETGRNTFVPESDAEHFKKHNPRWHYIGPLYTAPQPAAPAVPEGFCLMPKRLTRAMEQVMEEEDWAWESLLAAAEAITEEEHEELAAAPPAPEQERSVRVFPANEETIPNGLS